MSNLDHALTYAEKMQWRVLPCGLDKVALLKDWPNRASNKPIQIKQWWHSNPDNSIGIACGPDSGIWVLDVDLPEGPKTIKAWEDQGLVLPETLKQKTGSGGQQYFFAWNGRNVRNSSKKIGAGIDIRGSGGYVVVPPSSHPSGGKYEWIKKMKPQPAPDWLYDLIDKAKDRTVNGSSGGSSSYGEAALSGEIVELSRSTEGTRNENLNASAYNLGQLIGGGELDRQHVESMLLGVALGLGLKHKEARATINSGITAGMREPRSNPNKSEDYYFDTDESNQSNQTEQLSSEVITGNQEVIKGIKSVINGNQDSDAEPAQPPYNLAAHIKEWIINSTGSFTVDQLDREFCLTTRKDKMNRAKCLSIYKDKKLIRKDKTIKGKWHVIDTNVDWIDLDKADEAAFPITLPFGLSDKIAIPRRSIIILAGSTNAGKTAFILNTLKLNLDAVYERVYCMSEMQDGEYKDRVKSMDVSMDRWGKRVRATSRSYDFDGLIQHFNPNGLTCIDYLEEIDGEYFKIPSSIRDVYDSLENGVAIIAIQKKSNSDVARGGDATKDKARLYMTLDFLCALEHCIVCALKLTKVKKSLHENMQDKELHFRIERGAHLSVVMDWTPAVKVNRQKCIQQYTNPEATDDDFLFTFQTVDGGVVKLGKRDYDAWKSKFQNFNLDQELERISEDTYRKPWFKKKSWFWQLGNQLDKIENT